MGQFSEDAEEMTKSTCQQSNIETVSTITTTAAIAAVGAVCMETSFGVESDEPRTHIIPDMRSEHRLSLQLVPGLLIGCFSCSLLVYFYYR